jgi:hypothetical protein
VKQHAEASSACSLILIKCAAEAVLEVTPPNKLQQYGVQVK